MSRVPFAKRHTLKLLIQTPAARHTQCTYELFEVDRPILVDVEHIENVIRKFSRIAKGEELLVYATEFGLVELS
jgi:hypothetical protein